MRRGLSSLEILLGVLYMGLLVFLAVGLILVTISFTLPPGGAPEPAVLRGRMAITEGAVFTDELRNSSSPQFKSLAFDVRQLVQEAFHRGDLRSRYESCEVLYFSRGSVWVTFDVWFTGPVNQTKAEGELRAWLQDGRGLVIDRNSIQITERPDQTTASPVTVSTPAAVTCSPYQRPCADGSACVAVDRFCDGVDDCPDGSDEDATLCETACDGQFHLHGPMGSFSSQAELEETYESGVFCRWIIRVQKGLSVHITFDRFETEESTDVLRLYEGVGDEKQLAAELSGPAPPGTVWLLTDRSTVEFSSDDFNSLSGFKAAYSAADLSGLSNEEKLTCTFEQGMCFWRQQQDEDGDWIRTSGATFPPLTGPSVDHTLGTASGFYIVSPLSPGLWLKSFKIYSLPLRATTRPMCLHFWYHMFGEDVHGLRVLLLQTAPAQNIITVLFAKDGNYGDNWNYGQVDVSARAGATVVFEALKKGGMRNDIALDDITLSGEPCGPAPPEPTNVPPTTTPPPIPADCGGPFDLWEPETIFSSPNYPHSYGDKARCLWTIHAPPGWNIQLRFLDFDTEATYDMVEVRDGAGTTSTLLGVLTGSEGPAHDFISTKNQMTIWFFTDSSGAGRGFKATFISGVGLGSPDPCADGQFQCKTGGCIHGSEECDGVVDCPDASDEEDCVHLQVNGSNRLQFQLQSTLLTVCAATWSPLLSGFTCNYLGYRSGEAVQLPVHPQDSPFAVITVDGNGTLQANASDTCSGDRVVSLMCDNQPCGERLVTTGALLPPAAPRQDTGRVVGGVNAAKGAWPWMVSLQWRGRHVCGASVIGKDWLLTAAHCVYGKNIHLQLWTAKVGLHDQSDDASLDVQTRQIDRVIINTQYNRQTKQADIAMMHLQQPIDFNKWVQPVCLPANGEEFPAGRECFIAGWGREFEQGPLPDILQEAMVPLVGRDRCQHLLPEYNITSSMLCAGYLEGGVDSCQGDSGGPLMCLDDGHWTLTGVTSFGVGCARPEKPGVYARVSAFIPWIAETRRISSSHIP